MLRTVIQEGEQQQKHAKPAHVTWSPALQLQGQRRLCPTSLQGQWFCSDPSYAAGAVPAGLRLPSLPINVANGAIKTWRIKS